MLLSDRLNCDDENEPVNINDITTVKCPHFKLVDIELRYSDDKFLLFLFYKNQNIKNLVQSSFERVIESGDVLRFSAREAKAIRTIFLLEQSFQSHSYVDYRYLNKIEDTVRQLIRY